MSTKYTTPSGFPENLPPLQIVEDELKDIFAKVATSYGYTHLETCSVEYLSTLVSEGDISKEIFTIGRARGEGEETENERALHFDLTVPFARYVAEHENELSFPFRRYQIQKVWRGERPQKGRYREFYQADIDVVDRNTLSPHFDAEVVSVVARILSQFSIGNITISVNNRKLLGGIVEARGGNFSSTLRTIDKLDKIGAREVEKLLVSEEGMTAEHAAEIISLLSKRIPVKEAGSFLASIKDDNQLCVEGKEELALLCEHLSRYEVPGVSVVINPSIARGLDYYTGSVFETHIDGLEKYGSICSGGRYAELASRFTNTKLPGVGISIGLTRLLSIIETENLKSTSQKTQTQVLVCSMSDKGVVHAADAAQSVRETGKNTEVSYDVETNLGKLLGGAESRGIPTVVIVEKDMTYTVCTISTKTKQKYQTIEEVLSAL